MKSKHKVTAGHNILFYKRKYQKQNPDFCALPTPTPLPTFCRSLKEQLLALLVVLSSVRTEAEFHQKMRKTFFNPCFKFW